ncbi:leukotriene C4 synthase-like isoform X1 [Chelonia mydas]|uniref:leukotriene C4 synthase-like isoform X1 n=1 Tax=Chelonia mydas TaxID=8469 RepID=UPI0018A2089E|nr:leukotriene C4 synthase-like isoform X1 [Chelonia mydas]
MLDQIHLLAAVTILGVLEQAYFSLQVIYARRAYGISPPKVSGPPDFERVFRAQVNCSEYFSIFLAVLWQAGLFFHQGELVKWGEWGKLDLFSSVPARWAESTGLASSALWQDCTRNREGTVRIFPRGFSLRGTGWSKSSKKPLVSATVI